MITIYRMKDRIPIKIGPVEFTIGPLSSLHKADILSHARTKSGASVRDELMMAHKAIKYQVKAIKGVKNTDGSNYQVETNGDGLTDDSVSEIMQLEESNKLISALAGMLNGIKDPKVKGVEVVLPEAKN